MNEKLNAVEAKISGILATKPQCFITHPSELKVLNKLSEKDLRAFAEKRGWRKVRRIGGRQIEFYNDVTVRPQESHRTSPASLRA